MARHERIDEQTAVDRAVLHGSREKMRGMWMRVVAAAKSFANNSLGLRTWEDVRLQVHVLTPYAVSGLVAWNWLDQDKATLVGALVLAVASPAIAAWHTRDGFRRWVFGLLPATQAALVGFGLFTDSQVTPVAAAIVAVLGGHLAATNTPISRGPKDFRKAVAE